MEGARASFGSMEVPVASGVTSGVSERGGTLCLKHKFFEKASSWSSEARWRAWSASGAEHFLTRGATEPKKKIVELD